MRDDMKTLKCDLCEVAAEGETFEECIADNRARFDAT